MEGHVCKTCGYVSINGSAPDKCPVCMATIFELKENAINEPENAEA